MGHRLPVPGVVVLRRLYLLEVTAAVLKGGAAVLGVVEDEDEALVIVVLDRPAGYIPGMTTVSGWWHLTLRRSPDVEAEIARLRNPPNWRNADPTS